MLRFGKLYFAKEHVPLIKSAKISTSWRLFNHAADLRAGETVKFFESESGVCFGKARITAISDKKLSQITAEDRAGYEPVGNAKQMYGRFTHFYKREAGPNTPVRVIKFEFISK